MSDATQTNHPGSTDQAGSYPGLSGAELEAILADFRQWLSEAATPAAAVDSPEGDRVDLQTLLAQFTALRHEVNLQTKASRTANEQLAEAMKLLANPPTAVDPEASSRPAVKALIEVADALRTASQQVERTRDHLESLLTELEALQQPNWPDPPAETPPPAPAPTSWLSRLLGGTGPASTPPQDQPWADWAETITELQSQHHAAIDKLVTRWTELINGVGDGYTMSLRRMERTWPTLNIEPIHCLGEPFDPEIMEAIELVDGEESGTVVEVVRPGYRWNGKLFRFAQVKVAR